jgi:hypothetical protein
VVWVLLSSGLINLRVSYNYLEGFSRESDRQEAITSYMLERNKTLVVEVKDTVLLKKVSAIHQKSQELFASIQQLKIRMVQLSPGTPVDADVKDPSYLSTYAGNQYSSWTPKEMLAGYSPDRQKLEHDILAYRSLLVNEAGTNTVLAEGINQLMQPSVCLPDTGNSNSMILGNCLNQLSMLQNSVLISESQVIGYLEKPVVETQKEK